MKTFLVQEEEWIGNPPVLQSLEEIVSIQAEINKLYRCEGDLHPDWERKLRDFLEGLKEGATDAYYSNPCDLVVVTYTLVLLDIPGGI